MKALAFFIFFLLLPLLGLPAVVSDDPAFSEEAMVRGSGAVAVKKDTAVGRGASKGLRSVPQQRSKLSPTKSSAASPPLLPLLKPQQLNGTVAPSAPAANARHPTGRPLVLDNQEASNSKEREVRSPCPPSI